MQRVRTGKIKTGSDKALNNRLQMMLFFLRGSKRYFALSILFICTVSFLDLINPKIISYTVDSVIGAEKARAEGTAAELIRKFFLWIGLGSGSEERLGVIALIVTAVALLAAFFRYLFQLTNSMGAEKFVKRVRDELFSHIIRLPYAWHNENRTGDIIQRCTSDVETVKVFLSEQLTSLFRIVILMAFAFYFMFGIHTGLTLIAGGFIPVIALYSMYFHDKIGSAFLKADEEEGKLSAIVQENLTGVRVVRAFGRESYERERFERKNHYYTLMWIRLMRFGAAFWTVNDLMAALRIMVVTVSGAVFCAKGDLSAGNYLAFVAYNMMLDWPVRMLGRVISDMSKTGIAIDRILYIMRSSGETEPEDAVTVPMDREIRFEHVSFSYEGDGAEVLHDVSFTVPAGSTVGILGGTGSGKSTLMYLLDKLYPVPPENGRITIGGTDLSGIRTKYLRSNIGMVLQEPYLFSRTLSENIGITQKHLNMGEVRRAARIASLEESVNRFSRGYDTYVGERGVTLSGGQKQRAAIAQMLVRKPPVMIFDDSLSAVDAETDAAIRKALSENTGSSTVFLIAHRIQTLMRADQIIVMDRGRIVQQGTHEELAGRDGVYRVIYELQSGEDPEGADPAITERDPAGRVELPDPEVAT